MCGNSASKIGFGLWEEEENEERNQVLVDKFANEEAGDALMRITTGANFGNIGEEQYDEYANISFTNIEPYFDVIIYPFNSRFSWSMITTLYHIWT